MTITLHRTHPNYFRLDWRCPGDPGHAVLASILDFHLADGEATLLATIHPNGGGLDAIIDVERELDDAEVPTTVDAAVEVMLGVCGFEEPKRIDTQLVDPIMEPNWYKAMSLSAAGADHTLEFGIYGGASLAVTLYLQALKSANGGYADYSDGVSLTYSLKELPATVHDAVKLCERMRDELLPRFGAGERGDIDERATVL